MKLVLAGATGFIGKSLLQKLVSSGHDVTLLTRYPEKIKSLPNLKPILWNGRELGNWGEEISGADAVINLTGEPIARKKWTHEIKQDILQSRVFSTNALVQAMQKAEQKPKAFLNASAIGFYGHVDQGIVTEESPAGKGFLAETCLAWEKAALQAEALQIRVVLLRIGIVLEKKGGALSKMLLPFYFFIGGPLGSGKQGFAWIHRDDVIGAIEHALLNPELSGPVNVTGPETLDQKSFCKILGSVLHRPSWLRVPAKILRPALGEMSSLLLEGAKVKPEKLIKTGYTFKYPTAESALRAVLK